MKHDLRVAIVGAGLMGLDHVKRFTRIHGADVVAIVEPDPQRARVASEHAPEARVSARIEDAIEGDALDAVLIATPAPFHEQVLLPSLEAGLAILCEKPLSPTPDEALRIIEAEQRCERPRIQMGFMRRFDAEHMELRALIESGQLGELLAMHCVHRNPAAPAGFTDNRMIFDSVVHEMDSVPWLVGEPITGVEVKFPRRNSFAEPQLRDPQLILIEMASGVLADVEIHVNAGFGYQVRAEAVFERGVAEIGRPSGMGRWSQETYSLGEYGGFATRFADAYDTQVQRWIDAARRGGIDGPSAWDGYRAATAVAAGIEAQASGRRADVSYATRPTFYEG